MEHNNFVMVPLDSLEELENKIQIVKDNLQKKQDILMKVLLFSQSAYSFYKHIILGHIKTAQSNKRPG